MNRIKLTPLEQEYIKKYNENDDMTRSKLYAQGVSNDIVNELIQLRFDKLYNDGLIVHFRQKIKDDEWKNPFEVANSPT